MALVADDQGVRHANPRLDRVDAGIFHDFHHSWIEEIKRALNRGLLPPDHYALAEQIANGRGVAGVFLTPQRNPTRPVAESIVSIWGASEAEEWDDYIVYLPI